VGRVSDQGSARVVSERARRGFVEAMYFGTHGPFGRFEFERIFQLSDPRVFTAQFLVPLKDVLLLVLEFGEFFDVVADFAL